VPILSVWSSLLSVSHTAPTGISTLSLHDALPIFAAAHGIDLAASWAYSDSYSDFPMLAVVGRPTVCNPDRRLKAVARSYDWPVLDRKSTRLNSSHVKISYAVFCLKKKKQTKDTAV